uniref:Uncharacterized protein n=1 Tax=Entomoneis paludosa TaxID=265537 RepID=A0A7S3DN51_9STRA
MEECVVFVLRANDLMTQHCCNRWCACAYLQSPDSAFYMHPAPMSQWLVCCLRTVESLTCCNLVRRSPNWSWRQSNKLFEMPQIIVNSSKSLDAKTCRQISNKQP